MFTPWNVAFARPWPTTRRGLKLAVLSLIIGLKGVGYLHSTSAVTQQALRLFTERLNVPIQLCAWSIIAVCLVSLLCSYCHLGRDRIGYGLLTGFCGIWTVAYASSPVFFGGPIEALQGALSWLAIGVFLLLCAGDRPGEPLRRE